MLTCVLFLMAFGIFLLFLAICLIVVGIVLIAKTHQWKWPGW